MKNKYKKIRDFNRNFEALREAHVVPIYMDAVKRLKRSIEERIGPDMTDEEKDEMLGCLVLRLRGYLNDYAWAKAQTLKKKKVEGYYEVDTWGT